MKFMPKYDIIKLGVLKMRTVRKGILLGRVGYSEMDKNGNYWKLSVATDKRVNDANAEAGSPVKYDTIWFNVRIVNKNLFGLLENVVKGDYIFVEGIIDTYTIQMPPLQGSSEPHMCPRTVLKSYSCVIPNMRKREKSDANNEEFAFNVDSKHVNFSSDANADTDTDVPF